MALGGELVLLFTRHFPLLGDFLSGDTHPVGNAEVFVIGEDPLIGNNLVSTHGNHAHAFGTRTDHDVGLPEPNPVGSDRHGVQPGRAETVDRDTGNRVRKTRKQQPDAGDVHALFGFRHGTTNNHIVNGATIHRRYLHHRGVQCVRQHVIRARMTQNAARCLADRRPRRRHDVCVLDLPAHFKYSRSFVARTIDLRRVAIPLFQYTRAAPSMLLARYCLRNSFSASEVTQLFFAHH